MYLTIIPQSYFRNKSFLWYLMCPQCWILTSTVICDVSLCGLKNWFINISEEYSNIYPTRCYVTQFILSANCSTCFEWYLHPSSGAKTTVSTAIWSLSHHYCYLPLSWKSWNRFECAVGGVCHPQHTQTSSNSSTIAADSNNGVTNTRLL